MTVLVFTNKAGVEWSLTCFVSLILDSHDVNRPSNLHATQVYTMMTV